MDKIMADNGIDQYRVINLSDINKKQQILYDFLSKRDVTSENTEFEEKDASIRVYPETSFNDSKSVIVIFFPYLTAGHDFSGNISVYAQGKDYHLWGKAKLERISQDLKVQYPMNEFFYQMDNGPLNERFFASISGLGRKGINSMIINDKYGSYGFIGLIITDKVLDPYMTEIKDCSKCMKCKEKCPGKAIKGDSTIDTNYCASYITQSKKELSEVQMDIMKSSGYIFGCDICQKECPDNHRTLKTTINDTQMDIILSDFDEYNISKIKHTDISNISNKEFKKYFGEKAFSWRGKKILLRNLDIIEDKD